MRTSYRWHSRKAEAPLQRPTWQRLLALALPVIGLNVLNVLTLVVDTAMIGRMPHADDALAGLGFAVQLMFLVMVAMIGLSVGTVALVSRAHGGNDRDRVNHLLYQSSILTLVVGLGVAVIGNLIAEPLLRVLGANDAAVFHGLAYLRILMTGAALNYLNILYGSVLRGVGNTRLPFLIALASNAINVVLNYGLILGNFGLPAMGVQGAAIGTVTSHVFAVSVMVFLLSRRFVQDVHLDLRPKSIDLPLAKQLWNVGAPAALDMVVLNAGFLSILGMLGHIDQAAVAAHGVGLRVQALAFVPGMSVSQATGAMVGNALGAGNVDEARRVLRSGMALCMVIMGTLAALIITQAPFIIGLFNIDVNSNLGGYALQWMTLLGVCMPIVGVWVAFVGLFQGSGATKTSLHINMVATTAQIPASYILGFIVGWGTWGVWVAFPASFALKAAMGAVAYHRGDWAKTGINA